MFFMLNECQFKVQVSTSEGNENSDKKTKTTKQINSRLQRSKKRVFIRSYCEL